MKSRFRAAYLVLLCLACVPGALRAQSNAPTVIPIQGQLNDDADRPIDGKHTLRFELYTTPTPEPDALIYEETHVDVNIDRGFFTAYLGEHDTEDQMFTLSLFRDNKDIYLGIAVDDDELGEPLLQIGTSGYAAFAQYCATAATVQGMSGADLQPRVTGSCENGAISQIGENGQVDCQPVRNKDTRVSAGDGLQEGTGDDPLEMSIDPAYTQRRVTGTCSGNQFIQEVDQGGGVSCGSLPAQPSLDCETEVSDPPTSVEPGGKLAPPLEVECPSGYTAVGGGLEILGGPSDDSLNQLLGSYPAADAASWICRYHNESGSVSASVACRARCCRLQ